MEGKGGKSFAEGELEHVASHLTCALGATVLAAKASRAAGWWVAAALGLGAALAPLGAGFVVDPVWAALATALVAALALWRRSGAIVALCGVASGALAGVWCGLLAVEGVPLVGPVVASVAMVAASALLARQTPDFVSPRTLDEALVLLCVLALLAAALPGLLAGWESARILNTASRGVSVLPAGWVLVLALAALFSGALHTVWRRR